ncbi:hypothetical protein B0O99DRAFT_712609, partial [Bisporella sp. PMI_857]
IAEVLGTIASGISVGKLAGNITSNIIKLKAFRTQVKEAPLEVKYLLREIEVLGLVISEIGNRAPGINNTTSDAALQKCLLLCQESVGELGILVNEMSMKMQGKTGWK